MNCQNHPTDPATAYCRTCGQPVCDVCKKDFMGVVYCETHDPNNTRPIAGTPATPPLTSTTPPPSMATGTTPTPSVGLVQTLFRKKRIPMIIAGSLLIALVMLIICATIATLWPDSWFNQNPYQVFELAGGMVLAFVIALGWSPTISWIKNQTPGGRQRLIRSIEIGASVIAAIASIIKFHPSFVWILIVLGAIATIFFIWCAIKGYHVKRIATVAIIVLVLAGLGLGAWHLYNQRPIIPSRASTQNSKPAPMPVATATTLQTTPTAPPTDNGAESADAIAARFAAEKQKAADAATAPADGTHDEKSGAVPASPDVMPTPNQTQHATSLAGVYNQYGIKFSPFTAARGATDSGIRATDGGTFSAFTSFLHAHLVGLGLLMSDGYKNLTTDEALKTWSNWNPVKKTGYDGSILSGTGLDPHARVGSLSQDQLETLLSAIQQKEGVVTPAGSPRTNRLMTMAVSFDTTPAPEPPALPTLNGWTTADPNRPCEPSAADLHYEDETPEMIVVPMVDSCSTRNIHFPVAWHHWSFRPATDAGGWMIILARGLGPSGKVDLSNPDEVGLWNHHGAKILREERLRGKGIVVFYKIK